MTISPSFSGWARHGLTAKLGSHLERSGAYEEGTSNRWNLSMGSTPKEPVQWARYGNKSWAMRDADCYLLAHNEDL